MSKEEGSVSSDARGSRSYWLALRDRWPALAIAVVTALTAAAVLIQTVPKQYAAETDVQVNPIQSGDDRFVGLGLPTESNVSRSILTVARFVRNHQVAQAVAAKIGGNSNALLGEVQPQPQGQSNILTIAARAGSPERAADVANAFANTMVAQRTARFQELLTKQLARLNQRLAGLHAHGNASEVAGVSDRISFLSTYVGEPDPTLTVASSAVPQSRVVWPRTKLVLVVVALAALLLGGALIFALELLDPRVREDRQVAETGKPILARLPRITRRAARSLLSGDRLLPANVLATYRLLAEKLLEAPDGWVEEPMVVLVAGMPASVSEDNLAKTLTAVNVATLAASAGRRTIMVDADSQAGATHAFEVDGTGPDLANLLAGADHREVSRSVPSSNGCLWVVPSTSNDSKHPGSNSFAAFDLLGKKAVGHAFERLRADADIVVINGPPVANAAELIPFAQAADRVVIEVELGVTRQARLDELVQTFAEHEAKISGFVVHTPGRNPGTGGRLTYARTLARPTAASRQKARQPRVARKSHSLETNG